MENRKTFDYYVLLFLLVSVCGWLWEVCIYLVKERQFVNRGILKGPWLPVYGAGALFLYFLFYGLLHKWKKKFWAVFLLSMTVCSILEYGTGYFLEKAWGVKWWDYSDMFLNLDGHICLVSCLMFGIGGVFLVFCLMPLYSAWYRKIPARARVCVSLILLALFIIDAAYCADFPNAGQDITYEVFRFF